MLQVTCAIIIHEKKILITRRSAWKNMPLLWEFPGGKVEVNESKAECIVREIKEELNIDIAVLSEWPAIRYVYPDSEIELVPFTANYLSGELTLMEHEEYRWVDASSLNQFEFVPADVIIVNALTRSDGFKL